MGRGKLNFEKTYTYEAEFLASIFGSKYENELSDIFETYYLLAFQHKRSLWDGDTNEQPP